MTVFINNFIVPVMLGFSIVSVISLFVCLNVILWNAIITVIFKRRNK